MNADKLVGALREARAYVSEALYMRKQEYAGYEELGGVPTIEADLRKIDEALAEYDAQPAQAAHPLH